jgi:hypothetical protein
MAMRGWLARDRPLGSWKEAGVCKSQRAAKAYGGSPTRCHKEQPAYRREDVVRHYEVEPVPLRVQVARVRLPELDLRAKSDQKAVNTRTAKKTWFQIRLRADLILDSVEPEFGEVRRVVAIELSALLERVPHDALVLALQH